MSGAHAVAPITETLTPAKIPGEEVGAIRESGYLDPASRPCGSSTNLDAAPWSNSW